MVSKKLIIAADDILSYIPERFLSYQITLAVGFFYEKLLSLAIRIHSISAQGPH